MPTGSARTTSSSIGSASLEQLVNETLSQISGTSQFKMFAKHDREIRAIVLQNYGEIVEQTRAAHEAREEADVAVDSGPRVTRRSTALIALTVASALLISVLLGFAISGLLVFGIPRRIGVVLWGGILAGLFGLLASLVRRRLEARSRRYRLQVAADSVRQLFRLEVVAATEEAYTRAINDLLGPKGLLSFPTSAPRLIELGQSTIVPLKTLNYVKQFVAGHETSAIGIAGPRGSGKTTILTALARDRDLSTAAVVVTAPVKYDSLEFTRRLLLDVATEIDVVQGGSVAAETRGHRGRADIYRLGFAGLLIYVGIGAIALDYLEPTILNPNPFGVIGATGAAIAIAGGFLLLEASSRRRASRPRDRSTALVADALGSLSFDIETSSTTRESYKLLGGRLDVGNEQGSKRTRRRATAPDLARSLRDLLSSLRSTENWSGPFLIVVDELDKIAKVDDLVNVVNDMKDLFHIPGVHFLVSVSVEALSSFERRGMAARDAFDSSFDAVVAVEALAPDESLRVLASRAPGFPPVVGLVCHAWSGGLPRELLRLARSSVEIYSEAASALPLVEIVSTLIRRDLIVTLQSLIRSSTDQSEIAFLMKLRTVASQGTAEDLLAERAPELDSSVVARDIVELGLLTIAFFDTQISSEAWQADSAQNELVAANVAYAMASRGDVPQLRSEVVGRAKQLLREQRDAVGP